MASVDLPVTDSQTTVRLVLGTHEVQYPRSADNTIGWGYTAGLLRKRIIRARVTLRGNPFLNLLRGLQCLRRKVLSKRICEEG